MLFLSHSGYETENAKHLANQLKSAGVDVWLDVNVLAPGDIWIERIQEGLNRSTAFAVYVGHTGVGNWVANEVRVALDRNADDPRYRIFPILGPGANDEHLPSFLRLHQWLDLRKPVENLDQLRTLVAAVLEAPASSQPALCDSKSPYRGLQRFEEVHALYFFGRDLELTNLIKAMAFDPFLTITGGSGSGKSSLVRAGLIPALQRGRYFEQGLAVERWVIAVLRPGSAPFQSLADALPALDQSLGQAERLKVQNYLKNEAFSKGTSGLRDAIAILAPKNSRVLLLIDQFEEVFTLTNSKDERSRFIGSLLDCVDTDSEQHTHVVITMRADFYGQCWEYPSLPSRIANNQLAIESMSEDQLRDVIQRPINLTGKKLQPGLLETILHDVGLHSGNLPLLEYALAQLWEKSSGPILTSTAYESIGRVEGALQLHADEAYSRLNPEQQEVAKTIFQRLTRLGAGTEDTRRRVHKEDLLSIFCDAPQAEYVLEYLLKTRLLTSEGELVEVAHEAIIREWTMLRNWINDNRETLRVCEAADTAAELWREGARADRDLWSATRLQRATELRGQSAPFSSRAIEFLFASEEAQSILEQSQLDQSEIETLEKEAAKLLPNISELPWQTLVDWRNRLESVLSRLKLHEDILDTLRLRAAGEKPWSFQDRTDELRHRYLCELIMALRGATIPTHAETDESSVYKLRAVVDRMRPLHDQQAKILFSPVDDDATIRRFDRGYPGLKPFDETDRNIFFGRKKEIKLLLNSVLSERVVVLFAKSGFGKTSLLKAGLAPALLEFGCFPIFVRVFSATTNFAANAERIIVDVALSAASGADLGVVAGNGLEGLDFLQSTRFVNPAGIAFQPVVIFDQFEELWTFCDASERNAIVDVIARLTGNSQIEPEVERTNISVVLAIREDYVADLGEFTIQIPGILRNQIRLGPLNGAGAREVLVGQFQLSAKFSGAPAIVFTDDAIDNIVDALRGSRWKQTGDVVEPSLLQLMCIEIESKIKMQGDKGTIVSVDTPGSDFGLLASVTNFYENQISRHPSAARRLFEEGLINFNGLRVSLAEEEIYRRFNVSTETLKDLAESRLIRSERRAGVLYYEIAHDVLASAAMPAGRSMMAPRKKTRKRITAGLSGIIIVLVIVIFWYATVE